MSYYIAADGGGSKLLVVLYDENFHILRALGTGGTNESFKPREQIEREIETLAENLFKGLPEEVNTIDSLDLSIVGDTKLLADSFGKYRKIKEMHSYSEGEAALGACGEKYGVVAQAGTGSDAFLVEPDESFTVGGWGALLGDEGSGYDIGLNSLKAAIYAFDGRGPYTALLPMILEKWRLEKPWDMVKKLVDDPDYRKTVASVTPLAANVANDSDPVALQIFENAGHALALQVLTAIRRYQKPIEGPVVLSGGAWKGCRAMADAFKSDLSKEYPGLPVRFPIFEPLVGSIVLGADRRGISFSSIENTLKTEFSAYLYKIGGQK